MSFKTVLILARLFVIKLIESFKTPTDKVSAPIFIAVKISPKLRLFCFAAVFISEFQLI